jgi:hypothetical protein
VHVEHDVHAVHVELAHHGGDPIEIGVIEPAPLRLQLRPRDRKPDDIEARLLHDG